MRVLTVNAGSSSIRLATFDLVDGRPERRASHHGEAGAGGEAYALQSFLAREDSGPFDGVAHRVVHGGDAFVRPCVIDDAVERGLERLTPLAPLHTPATLAWIRACRAALGVETPAVAVFDTAFFARLPPVARTYALPRSLGADVAIRRYGFHGLAHDAMWRRWRVLAPAAPRGARVISLQLGAGCSVTAMRDGVPVDTSMGFSPLEGLVMATRSGDVDPGLVLYLQRTQGLGPADLEALLNEASGLLGVSGRSADMRELLAADDDAARLAVDLYCYRARKYVGAFLAVLGGADAILFGGGVGEHAPAVRERILAGMQWAGIELDGDANGAAVGAEARIDSGGPVEVRVVTVDEAAMLASAALAVLHARNDDREVGR
jgi:acetate kinase